MTEAWKIRRELSRIGRQMTSLSRAARAVAMGASWKRAHDAQIEIHQGAAAVAPDIALIVVFQPGGCCESLFETLAHLKSRGFSPLVVRNSGLSEGDLSRLSQLAWRVMSRPNLGYDFGGYRDGIRYLQNAGTFVRRLLIMNDTLWWPATTQQCCLDALIGLKADYAGLCNFPYRPGRKRSAHLTGRLYVSSFGFLVSRRVWNSAAFRAFWADMPLHAEKPKVVECGEVGFCRTMMAEGFDPKVLIDHAALLDEIERIDDEAVTAFLSRLPVVAGGLRAQIEAFEARSRAARAAPGEARALMRKIMPTLNPWDSMAVNGLADGRVDFIKKANLKSPGNARRFIEMSDEARVALTPTVRSEIVRHARSAGLAA